MKVQKRGSVGRSIDITRYLEYDDLRHDLAHMFRIEGQLDDQHRMEWKLVYVDHENDILLVGDDSWEEFVSCVQSIKILPSSEVQQLSLDGNLGNAQLQNPASLHAVDPVVEMCGEGRSMTTRVPLLIDSTQKPYVK
ncbi:hypothetical protein GIB67_026556 [Kingdonia uniflora]|uniref:Auxin-responsive protein n=1 Tax=Kingdonia uniflora TaxID=39325 RepID=A0A7J7PBS0_9MAGN|nr:hypothetical protein GIB67_026556 [Kingdonia uniflora]